MRPLAMALLAVILAPAALAAQISPGPLSRAHQSLEGTLQCTQCHGRARDAMPRLCLSCHREVGWLVSQQRGLHASEPFVKGKTCASCHPEHAGREFELVEWPDGEPERFDHGQAGWPLEGEHRQLDCQQCHRREYRTTMLTALSPRKANAGWMGLAQGCTSCHEDDDAHRGSLGPECGTCHVAEDWSPAPGFDHDASGYALDGAHETVACAACHDEAQPGVPPRSDGSRVPRFTPQAHRECSDCHADPHRGRLSSSCSSCHVTQGFAVRDAGGFNHALTRYPLQGRHRTTACEACHGRDLATPRPAFDRCAACHDDRHGGETLRTGSPTDCTACHDTGGFRPATFTVAQHGATTFPLGGRHATVQCASCHVPTGEGRTAVIPLHPAGEACAACHQTPHGDQLPAVSCESCHRDTGWDAVQYDRTAHATTQLPLEGRHAVVGCASCHGPERPGLPPLPAAATGTAGVLFHLPEVRCAACHANPHRPASGQVATPNAADDCSTCHGADSFRSPTMSLESHARFAFALDGAHRAVPCVECHTGFGAAPTNHDGLATLVASGLAVAAIPLAAVRGEKCADCHESPHGEQFRARDDGGRCDACHDTDRFANLERFDHGRDAAFALDGAHARVACAGCHRREADQAGGRVVYRPVPRTCEACHRGRSG